MLKRFLPSCLGGSKIKQETRDQVPRKKTSQLYDSHIGKILINWSHLFAGLFLYIEIPLSQPSSWTSSLVHSFQDNCTGYKQRRFFSLRIYPDEKRGLRRFKIKRGIIQFAWEFSNAKFCTSGDAQPESGYFFCITINGEMVLLLGDMKDEAYGFTKARKLSNDLTASLISREDMVDLRGHRKYRTKVNLGDDERVASVSISYGDDVAMKVSVGKKKVIDVKSIWNEISGSKKLVSGEEMIEVSWNRLDWIPSKSKTKKNTVAPKSEMTGLPLPVVVVDFSYTRKGGTTNHSSFAVNLISS